VGDSDGAAALPDGYVVRLARKVQVLDEGRVLVGGSPTRVTRLSPAALGVLDRVDGGYEVRVRDADSRTLAGHLIQAGMANPVIADLPAVPLSAVTVVIPVRDRPRQLGRLLASLPAGVGGVIVVDDASVNPAAVATVVAAHGARLLPLARNLGVAGARNVGLARVMTPFVAFIDSDVLVEQGTLETLLLHFADPRVALVAPRIVGIDRTRPNWITRYENARSSLDLGDEAALVRPRSPVTWVSGTCQVCRVSAIGDGYDPTMDAGEDVAMVWRLVDAGFRVRYEPSVTMRHEHRTTLRTWLGRKFFYGTGAQALAIRHARDVAPVVLPPWAVITLLGLLGQRRWSVLVSGATTVVVALRIRTRLRHVRRPTGLAMRLMRDGVIASIAQGFALLLRHWWPLTVIGCLFSRRLRTATLVAAVIDTAWEYVRVHPRMDPFRFAVARRLDDAAYGAGVWWGAIRGRSWRALMPAIVRTTSRRS
jgi:mycofactocin system glycosyltransferase